LSRSVTLIDLTGQRFGHRPSTRASPSLQSKNGRDLAKDRGRLVRASLPTGQLSPRRRRQAWCLHTAEPNIFEAGARAGFSLAFDRDADGDGYPGRFKKWSAQKRDSWVAGFDYGFHARMRLADELARRGRRQ
jgi:hypothetical protein